MTTGPLSVPSAALMNDRLAASPLPRGSASQGLASFTDRWPAPAVTATSGVRARSKAVDLGRGVTFERQAVIPF